MYLYINVTVWLLEEKAENSGVPQGSCHVECCKAFAVFLIYVTAIFKQELCHMVMVAKSME